MFTSVTIAGETEPPPYLSRKDVDAAALAAQTLTSRARYVVLEEFYTRFTIDFTSISTSVDFASRFVGFRV